MSQLQKASAGHLSVERMLDIEQSCHNLLGLLWKLNVLKPLGYDEDWFDGYDHYKPLVSMWYQLYMEMHGT